MHFKLVFMDILKRTWGSSKKQLHILNFHPLMAPFSEERIQSYIVNTRINFYTLEMRTLRWAGKWLSYGFILANSLSKALAFWIHIPRRLKHHRRSGLKSLQWICEKNEYCKQYSFPWLSHSLYLFYYLKNLYCWRLSH